MALTVLAGSAFCVSDDLGDIAEGVDGFYAADTRHLSRLVLRIDRERPELLTSRAVDHYGAVVYARAGTLVVRRTRRVAGWLDERIVLQNESSEAVAVTVTVELAADFADSITVKEHALHGVPPVAGLPLPPSGTLRAADSRIVITAAEGDETRTTVALSEPATVEGGTLAWRVELGPRRKHELRLDVAPVPAEPARDPERALAAWRSSRPRLCSRRVDLAGAYAQSIDDLAALRLDDGALAAGAPWFMTLFGRDSIIASLQTMLLGPETAVATVEALAALQAESDDPSIDAEPGKIVHEVRSGRAARGWFERYYGSLDATPLFLVLVSEVWRWTGDAELVARFRAPALRALAWLDEYGDRDGDGFLEYERRTPRGLPNQSWKDSYDSQRFADGHFAEPPIAPCEVQGYAYDAKRRVAELARGPWGEPGLAERLEREAAALQSRFDSAFWLEQRGGYYALALDGGKRPVDALCSNLGHLLWSGIVPEHRVDAVVGALLGDELWTGWGVRTMSAADAAYHPLGYHRGTVWPHDTSLGAQGLARYGRWEEAGRVARGLFEASAWFGGSLPEAFAGIPRADSSFPVAYPVAGHPQAWGAAAAVLLLRVLLGLEPDVSAGVLRTVAPHVPDWLGDTRVTGVRAFRKAWDVTAEAGSVRVEPAIRA